MKPKKNIKNDDWKTPQDFYEKLNEEFDFNFDPCPYKHDLKKWDGLKIDWKERNFVNPPYSRKLKEQFILKSIEEAKKGKLCVLLIPVSTSTKIFHDHILKNKKEIRFIKGRIKFEGINSKGGKVKNKVGTFDSMIVVFDGREK